MGKGKERFGFLGIKGPKEKLFGGRRGNESRKEWKARIAREADKGSQANKLGLSKSDIAKAGSAKHQVTIETTTGTARTIQTRDMALVRAVDANDADIVGLASDLTSTLARIEVLEAFHEADEEDIQGMNLGLGNILSWLDPIVAGINAADVPTIPLAAQAGAFLSVASSGMSNRSMFGLGQNVTKALAFGLRILAYYDPEVGLTSLFTADGGGIIAVAPTAAPLVPVATLPLSPVGDPVLT